jgi:hypothetical protein
MDNLFEKALRKEIRKIILEMSGFPRVKNMMMGAVDSVNTVGIITAENPFMKKVTPEYNKEYQEKLKTDLKSLKLGYVQIKGKYEQKENPFFVPNIKKDELLKLQKKYNQESVIYGEKKDDKEKMYFKWEFIKIDGNIKIVYSNISNKGDILTRDDFYSMVKGKKFYIPFFDKNPSDEKPSAQYSTPKSYFDKTKNHTPHQQNLDNV